MPVPGNCVALPHRQPPLIFFFPLPARNKLMRIVARILPDLKDFHTDPVPYSDSSDPDPILLSAIVRTQFVLSHIFV